MMNRAIVMTLVLTALMSLTALVGHAQEPSDNNKVDAYLELLRSDLRTKKAIIIKEQLTLSQPEADAFWPIYKRYETATMTLNDEKVALIKDYAQNYQNLSDAKARALANKMLDLDDKRQVIRRKFYQEFEKALSGKSAAQFAQIDRRIDLLMDLQIAGEVPMIK
jgi:Spy/CpxP family protein refolding chaperone